MAAFIAPEPGDAVEKEWSNAAALGLRLSETRELIQRFGADFAVEHWGFAQFADLAERQRAVVPDELWAVNQAIPTNLVEMALHEREVNRLVGSDGLSMPREGAAASDYLVFNSLYAHVAGYFRAFGSALDCLATAIVGVLRLPVSIRRAAWADLGRVKIDQLSEDQANRWQALQGTISDQVNAPPTDSVSGRSRQGTPSSTERDSLGRSSHASRSPTSSS